MKIFPRFRKHSPDDEPGNETPLSGVTHITPDTDETSSVVPTIPNIAEAHAESYAGFDPELHAVNADGTPRRKTDGSYALKRGRKATGAHNALPPKNAQKTSAVGEAANAGPILINVDEAARQSANLVINASVWICGQEIGQPIDKAEAQGLQLSFKNYYDARGVPNIPPEIGLLLALGSYVAPRLMHEKTRPRMERLVMWAREKVRF